MLVLVLSLVAAAAAVLAVGNWSLSGSSRHIEMLVGSQLGNKSVCCSSTNNMARDGFHAVIQGRLLSRDSRVGHVQLLGSPRQLRSGSGGFNKQPTLSHACWHDGQVASRKATSTPPSSLRHASLFSSTQPRMSCVHGVAS